MTEHIFQVINHISLIVIYGQVEINKKYDFMKILVPLAFCEAIETYMYGTCMCTTLYAHKKIYGINNRVIMTFECEIIS